jgi:hypothetical protein
MPCPLAQAEPSAYGYAQQLLEHGVPLFLARPAGSFPHGGSGSTGYLLPPEWQTTEPDLAVLERWRPGMALCAVMGHAVDGLDVDPQKGGQVPPELVPTSYGRQRTPSGGTHDLIAPLGLRSRDGILPGVDYKGGVAGIGHGFLFLAPTLKLSKTTGQVEPYEWLEPPSLGLLDLLGRDPSGQPLASWVNAGRANDDHGRPEYEGPSYEELTEARREQADKHVEDTIYEWRLKLGEASGWEEGQVDYAGRGWEALVRDAAWAVARLAACPWTGLDPERAHEVYESLVPEVIAADPKCRGKWYEGILEKAAARPANQPPWWSEIFFEQTPVLQRIQQAALSTMNVPEGLLAVILGRVLAEVPPWVMLPPLSYGGLGGASAGLNMGIALVANSGGGKSGAVKASRQFLGLHGLDQKSIEEGAGSGEGMIDMFLEEERMPDPKNPEQMKPTGRFILKADPRVIYNVDEVEQLAAVGHDRQGSTMNSTMRTALTGGALKTSNSRAGGRYRAVDEDTYRLVVMVGVQPARADVLLSGREESVGTPQRFLWAKMVDKDLNLPDPLPSWPESLDWEPPTDWPEQIQYPEHVRGELLEQKRRQVKEEASPTEGHLMLTRLKVAFALGVLHGETKISDQWWSLAGLLMDQSRSVQAECKRILGETAQANETHTATRKMRAQAVAEEVVSEGRLEACARSLITRLQKTPGREFSWSVVKPAHRLRVGLETTDVIEEARRMDPGLTVREYEAQGRTAYMLQWTGEES